MVNRVVFTYIWALLLLTACGVGNKNGADSTVWEMQPLFGDCDTVAIDTMDIVNPFITYDRESDVYYMTGDNGYVWKSKELRLWVGPYNVLAYDTASWLGTSPVIKSPQIHEFAGKYYYMAAFETNEYSSCATLVADSITGPYKTIDSKSFLLDIKEKASYPTFCSDEFGAGYMIYSSVIAQENDGVVQIVLYNEDLGRRLGEAYTMFAASQIPYWHKVEEGEIVTTTFLGSPFLFHSGNDCLGMLFVANNGEKKAVGVAYSETGTLDGPWVVQDEPLLVGYENVSMFRDYDGTLVMLAGKDTIMNGVKRSVPKFIKTDSQFDKLQIKGYYKF